MQFDPKVFETALADAEAELLRLQGVHSVAWQSSVKVGILSFLTAASAGQVVERPASVQAAFEVFDGKPDTGPHAKAMFQYILCLEAALYASPVASPPVTDGMVERAARAIAAQTNDDFREHPGFWRKQARAALSAALTEKIGGE